MAKDERRDRVNSSHTYRLTITERSQSLRYSASGGIISCKLLCPRGCESLLEITKNTIRPGSVIALPEVCPKCHQVWAKDGRREIEIEPQAGSLKNVRIDLQWLMEHFLLEDYRMVNDDVLIIVNSVLQLIQRLEEVAA